MATPSAARPHTPMTPWHMVAWITSWLMGATIIGVLLPTVFAFLGGSDSPLGSETLLPTMAIAGRITGTLALLIIPCFVGAMILERRTRYPLRWLLGLSTLVLAYPAWDQASFLASGGFVSQQWWNPLFQGGAFVVILLILVITAGWLVMLPAALGLVPSAGFAPRHRRLFVALGLLAGLLGAALAAYQVSLMPHSYTHTARLLVSLVWIVGGALAGLLLMALLGLVRRPLARGLVGLGLVAILALPALVVDDQVARGEWNQSHFAAISLSLLPSAGNEALAYDLSTAPAAGCPSSSATPTPPSASPPGHRNVILITVDALRFDMVGRLVGGAPLTPAIDSFGEGAVTFSQAYTPYPATIFAMGGALTGIQASRIMLAPTSPPSVFTLTAGYFDNQTIILPDNHWFDRPSVGETFLQGITPIVKDSATKQVAALMGTLKQAKFEDETIFAWVHLYEPHRPYTRHKGYPFPSGREGAYMSEVAYTDAAIGKLLQFIEQGGWLDDTLVLVFADHGEALGEEQYFGHHVYLDTWLSHVPFFLSAPGTPAGAVVDVPTSLVDVPVTILDFLGLPVPAAMHGKSLLDAITAPPSDAVAIIEAFPIRGEELHSKVSQPIIGLDAASDAAAALLSSKERYTPKVGIVKGHHLLVHDQVLGTTELFDLATDPQSTTNILAAEPQIADDLTAALAAWFVDGSAELYCSHAAVTPP